MNPKGYEIVLAALRTDERTIGSEIRPKPQEGQDVRDIEIIGRGLGRPVVLAVLGKAGFMRLSPEPSADPDAPRFAYTGTVSLQLDRTKVTHKFIDTKAGA